MSKSIVGIAKSRSQVETTLDDLQNNAGVRPDEISILIPDSDQTGKVPENRIADMTADRFDFFPLRIFVVEDDNDTLEAIQIYLQRLGHIVFSARSKAEAVKKIPRANCHVLISDINLPDGNGWELMQEIEDLRPNYAIAISGYGMKADRQRSAESGFRHHVVKPVFPDRLDTLLEEATAELRQKE
jgi:CheY-like chemotaxis protein